MSSTIPTIYCAQCGKPCPTQASFCWGCGSPLNAAKPQEVEGESAYAAEPEWEQAQPTAEVQEPAGLQEESLEGPQGVLGDQVHGYDENLAQPGEDKRQAASSSGLRLRTRILIMLAVAVAAFFLMMWNLDRSMDAMWAGLREPKWMIGTYLSLGCVVALLAAIWSGLITKHHEHPVTLARKRWQWGLLGTVLVLFMVPWLFYGTYLPKLSSEEIEDLPQEAKPVYRAARKGDMKAAYVLGVYFLEQRNERLGWAYVMAAARQHHPDACLQLALLIDSGSYPPAQPPEAIKWYKTAIKLGHPMAKKALKASPTYQRQQQIDEQMRALEVLVGGSR